MQMIDAIRSLKKGPDIKAIGNTSICKKKIFIYEVSNEHGENGDATLFRENNKVFQVLQGDVVFQVDSVNAAEGEFSGKFVSNQPGDTDMGGKDPKNILLKGIFYGRFE